ncbi:hypothetical protein BDR26DRAFT_877143 [Obelidium mucronatum]|nr:hypothetical protein BDR26DRAFT_877143 [Obelidium mucronatum]
MQACSRSPECVVAAVVEGRRCVLSALKRAAAAISVGFFTGDSCGVVPIGGPTAGGVIPLNPVGGSGGVRPIQAGTSTTAQEGNEKERKGEGKKEPSGGNQRPEGGSKGTTEAGTEVPVPEDSTNGSQKKGGERNGRISGEMTGTNRHGVDSQHGGAVPDTMDGGNATLSANQEMAPMQQRFPIFAIAASASGGAVLLMLIITGICCYRRRQVLTREGLVLVNPVLGPKQNFNSSDPEKLDVPEKSLGGLFARRKRSESDNQAKRIVSGKWGFNRRFFRSRRYSASQEGLIPNSEISTGRNKPSVSFAPSASNSLPPVPDKAMEPISQEDRDAYDAFPARKSSKDAAVVLA